MRASGDNFPLLAELLAEQQKLDTPAARFSRAHEAAGYSSTRTAALAPQLIPLSAPRAGEQYAFEVDLDSCTGCKSCVAACHSLNGLDETETWRDVGLIVSADRRRPFTQTVTTACHHCEDPACLNGCPVLAYDKDPITGIVRHLDDQCIGCSYCILKCPYDVPKFSERLGIVRKCDMCHGRLAAGEAPACAQACPTHAIRIVTVVVGGALCPDMPAAKAESGPKAPSSNFLPCAPEPSYTRPTTRYVSKRVLPPELAAGDAGSLRPQPPHWPLVVMLTLIPGAVGLSCLAALSPALRLPESVTYYVTLSAALTGAAGLGASVFHLGQPLRAWRIFLGWRKSWLSREAMVLGAWFALASATVLEPRCAPAAAFVGLAGLFCSIMIYVDTRRTFWRFGSTAPRFFGTGVVLSLAALVALSSAPQIPSLLLALATVTKLVIEANALATLRDDNPASTSARKTALLLSGPLRHANELRALAGLTGGVLAPLALASGALSPAVAWFALPVILLGELVERMLFFRAVDAPKMPGVSA
jgi:formate dehydrogenase iron-sulfur subunit